MSCKQDLEKFFSVMFAGTMPVGYKNDVLCWGNITRDNLCKKLPFGTTH